MHNPNHILKKVFILLFFVTISGKVKAQTTETQGFQIPNYAPKSPEASAFLKYGEYPVDLSTGVPSISIPLYSVDIKDFKLPITLDYHASGIKVNQEATWVGLGWNLNAGAQIILSARDDIDENNLYIDDIPNSDNVVSYFQAHPYDQNGGYIGNNHLDVSRVKDMFSFSSPTANGNFYIRNFAENDVVIVPPNAFKVELLGADRKNLRFKIIDIYGNVYSFNTKEISERTMTHGDSYTSAWYVDEIKTATNNKINFVYQDDGVIRDAGFLQRIEVKRNYVNIGCDNSHIDNTNSAVIDEGGSTLTNAKKIKEIIFNDGNSKVVFEKINGRQDLIEGNGYLKKIEVQQLVNSQFQIVKGYIFDYSYFDATSSYSDGSSAIYNTKRLKLDRVLSLVEGFGHEFVYSDLSLPNKTSKQQDYYGYYNGANNQNLVPKHYIYSPFIAEVGNADREVNPGVNQVGILKEIHFPTKGWTKFNYESNQYFDYDAFAKYKLIVVNSSVVEGTGTGTVAPNEAPGIDDIPVCMNSNTADCVKYVKVPFEAINGTGLLVYQVNNQKEGDITVKYSYARVRVYVDGAVQYDSGTLKNTSSFQINASITLQKSGFVLIEAYGSNMSIVGLQLRYTNDDPAPKNNFGSGLRIQNIENYNYDNTLVLKKEYDYSDLTNENRSSGKLINEMSTSFVSFPFTDYYFFSCPLPEPTDHVACIPGVNYKIAYNISSNSRYGIEGNTVVYKYVKERTVDVKNGDKNGYIEYEFLTDADEIPFGNPTVQIPTTWKRGKILEKRTYKTIGSTNYLLQKEKNTYFEDIPNASYYKGFKMFRNATTNIQENPLQPTINSCPFIALGDMEMLNFIEPITFNIPIPWFYQKTSEITEKFYNNSNSVTGTVVTLKAFNYDNPEHLQLTSQTVESSKSEILETKYYYAPDSEIATAVQPKKDELRQANMIGIPLVIKTFRSGIKLSEQLTVFDKDPSTSDLLLPKYIYTNKEKSIDTTKDKKITYDLYDEKGNLEQYTQEGGVPVCYIWGYNKTNPIAKIENIAYSVIPTGLITAAQNASNTGTENDLLTALTTLRNDAALSNAMVTGFTYKPLVGVKTIIDPNGNKTFYEYDFENRLVAIRDSKGNILSEYKYHYKN